MNLNLIVVLSIVWIVSYVLFLSAVSTVAASSGVLEIVKMAVTGLFGIITGAAGAAAYLTNSKNASAPTEGQN